MSIVNTRFNLSAHVIDWKIIRGKVNLNNSPLKSQVHIFQGLVIG